MPKYAWIYAARIAAHCLGKRRRRSIGELPKEVQTAMYLAALDSTPDEFVFADIIPDSVFQSIHNEAWSAGVDALAILRERKVIT